MPVASARGHVILVTLAVFLSACGQKGPPLPPLHLVPAAVTELSARRIGDQVRLRFVLPTTNANGPGPLALDRVEIYAVTVPPGVTPANRVLLDRDYLVGQIAVRPPLAEGEEPKEGDTRPAPGAAVVFDEALTPAALEPVQMKEPPPPATPAAAPPAAVPGESAPAAPVSTTPVRIYAARGVTKSGRPGPPSTRVQIPIMALPPPPAGVDLRVTETAVVAGWTSPEDQAATLTFNIYRTEEPKQPINAAPLTEPTFEYRGVEFGQEYCFQIRSVIASKSATIEGEPSEPRCVSPVDVFPPAAPSKPDAVAIPGQISLIWDANTEKDLGGYLVLRGPAPDGPLQALTTEPIQETSYRDTTVEPGVRYVYAIVAVDKGTPPNASPQSPRVEETAR